MKRRCCRPSATSRAAERSRRRVTPDVTTGVCVSVCAVSSAHTLTQTRWWPDTRWTTTPNSAPDSRSATSPRCGTCTSATAERCSLSRCRCSEIATSRRSACNRPSSRHGGRRSRSILSEGCAPGWRRSPAGQRWTSTAAKRRTHSEPHADVDDTVVPIAFERTWEAFEVRAALDQLPARRARGGAPRPLRGAHAQRDRRPARRAGRNGEVAIVPSAPPTGRPCWPTWWRARDDGCARAHRGAAALRTL